ncbi:hypothetical protein PINS_up012772 [Pythium insidiosum]|nr:hypothetical protein PINS_up012772 [Pythium insidiosum]
MEQGQTRPDAAQQRQRAREAVERHREQQRQTRDEMMQALDEKRRIEEQRVYREQLAVDNSKRKQRRRQQRAKAKYDKFLATIETKRRQQLGLSRIVLEGEEEEEDEEKGGNGGGVGVSASVSQRPSTVPSSSNLSATTARQRPSTRSRSDASGGARRRAETAPTVVGLSWHRTTPSDSRAQSRGGRPTWVPQELWSLHDANAAAANDAMVQCEQLHAALQQTHARKERLRAVYSAPDAELLKRQQQQQQHGGEISATKGMRRVMLPTLPRTRPETAP